MREKTGNLIWKAILLLAVLLVAGIVMMMN